MNDKNNIVKSSIKTKRPTINRTRFGSTETIQEFLKRQFKLNNGEEIKVPTKNKKTNKKPINKSPQKQIKKDIKSKPIQSVSKTELNKGTKITNPKIKIDKPLEVNEHKELPKKPVNKKNTGMFKQIKDKITGNNDNVK